MHWRVHSRCLVLSVLHLFSLMIEIHHVSALIFYQKAWKVNGILRLGTLSCQIGFGFACIPLALYFCWRTQGRRNVFHLEPAGKTKSWEIGLSYPWAQPISKKISVYWRGKLCFTESSIVWEKWYAPEVFKKPFEEMNGELCTWFKYCGMPGWGAGTALTCLW